MKTIILIIAEIICLALLIWVSTYMDRIFFWLAILYGISGITWIVYRTVLNHKAKQREEERVAQLQEEKKNTYSE